MFPDRASERQIKALSGHSDDISTIFKADIAV